MRMADFFEYLEVILVKKSQNFFFVYKLVLKIGEIIHFGVGRKVKDKSNIMATS